MNLRNLSSDPEKIKIKIGIKPTMYKIILTSEAVLLVQMTCKVGNFKI